MSKQDKEIEKYILDNIDTFEVSSVGIFFIFKSNKLNMCLMFSIKEIQEDMIFINNEYEIQIELIGKKDSFFCINSKKIFKILKDTINKQILKAKQLQNTYSNIDIKNFMNFIKRNKKRYYIELINREYKINKGEK